MEALRALLEPGKYWQPTHWLRATRLLGRQPSDALSDRDVALIFIGSIQPGALGARAFRELAGDIGLAQLKRFRKRVEAAWPELFGTDGATNCREMLVELVDAHIEHFDAEFAAHEENAEKEVKREIDRLGVDRDKEGTLVREYYQKCWRLFQRGIANYEKLKGRDTPKKRGDDWSRDPNLDWARKPFADGSERKSRLVRADALPEQAVSATAGETLRATATKI